MQKEKKYLFDSVEHIHSLGGKPLIGTSTAMGGGFPKDALIYWALQRGLATLGFMPPRRKEGSKYVTNSKEERLKALKTHFQVIKSMSDEEYLKALDNAYVAHTKDKDKAATEGTDLHAMLETYVKMCMVKGGVPNLPLGGDVRVMQFAKWAVENVEKFIISEAHVYSREMWTGGILDCAALMKNGKYAIIDFKSSKDSYLSQFAQISMYDLQQEENGFMDSNGVQIHGPIKVEEYYVVPFGAMPFKVDRRVDTDYIKVVAKAALTIYKALNIELE